MWDEVLTRIPQCYLARFVLRTVPWYHAEQLCACGVAAWLYAHLDGHILLFILNNY